MTAAGETRRRGWRWTTPVLAATALAVQIPFLGRGIAHLDEGHILAVADGLHHGELLYSERVTQLPPLLYEALALLFDAFGASLEVARALQAVVLLGCVLIAHAILRQLVRPLHAAVGAVAILGVKPLAFPFWNVANYSPLALMFALASVLLLLRYFAQHRTAWLVGAGVCAGLTVITKQNLGAYLAAVLSLALALDWWVDDPRRVRTLVVRGAQLGLAAVVPAIGVAIHYARLGTLDALIQRTLVGALGLTRFYRLPLPSLDLWAYRLADLGDLAFAYFPVALVQQSWQGELNFYSRPLVLAIELTVKAIYYLPVAILAVGFVQLVRIFLLGRRKGGWPSEERRAEWSGLTLVLVFAAMGYASMLYRPDWIHLMNVYPALMIPCVVVLSRCGRTPGGRWFGRAVLAIWVGASLATTASILLTYRVPVETARGRLLLPPLDAEEVARFESYLADQPRDERILIFPDQPIHYFLSNRRIPVAFDQILPGVLKAEDDERLAAQLRSIDQVIYNPRVFPTVPIAVTDYLPRTARALANDFVVESAVSSRAVALRPRRGPRPDEATVLELWDTLLPEAESRRGPEGAPSVPGRRPSGRERAVWLMYRVVATPLLPRSTRSCVHARHRVSADEAIAALPIFHPDLWSRPEGPGARFVVRVRGEGAPAKILDSEFRRPGLPGAALLGSLAEFQGQAVDIEFCIERVSAQAGRDAEIPVGWAEPRVVRLPAQP